jgi:hypothetical protein
MVKQKDILQAINRMLIAVYPDYTIYIQDCPKDFDRPSFMIEFVRTNQIDVSRTTIEKTVYYTITCFTIIDEYYRSDPEELADLQETILQKLLIGYLLVGDRALKVKASTGGLDPDRAYIDLQLEYYDNRTDEADQTPLATSVTTKIQEV